PRVCATPQFSALTWALLAGPLPLLVVEDSTETIFVYEKALMATDFQVLAARNLREAHDALASFRPRAILLDIALKGEDAWELLAELKRRPPTRDIPGGVVTNVKDEGKAIALGADAYCEKPVDRQRLVQTLNQLVSPESMR